MLSVWQSIDVILKQYAAAVATYTRNKPIRQAKTMLGNSCFGNRMGRRVTAIRPYKVVRKFDSTLAKRNFLRMDFVQSWS